VAVVPRGVDVDLFDGDAARPSTVPILAALGPFPGSRDIGALLQAIAIVLREHPVRLRLLGETDRARTIALNEKIRRMSLGAVVEVKGAIDLEDLPSAFAAADVGIACAAPVDRYLSAGDWVPGVLELMACRRPVVAARVPAIRDVFADRREVLLYEPGDASSLAEAISSLLRSATRRDAVAQAGYRRIREDFPASATRRRLLALYRTLAPPLAPQLAPPLERASTTPRPAPPPTPTPISLAPHDTGISFRRPDPEDPGGTGTGDTSPGVPPDPPDHRPLDTEPEIQMQREPARAAPPSRGRLAPPPRAAELPTPALSPPGLSSMDRPSTPPRPTTSSKGAVRTPLPPPPPAPPPRKPVVPPPGAATGSYTPLPPARPAGPSEVPTPPPPRRDSSK
jgi:hypothetical protein